MPDEQNNKIAIRKEIASLIDALKSESDRIGNNNLIPKLSTEQLLETIEELHHKIVVYSYLLSLPEEKITEQKLADEIRETIIVPTPEPVIPQTETVPPVIFETPAVQIPAETKKEIPIVPVIPVEPETKKETPIVPPTKKYPDVKSMIGFNERLMFLNHLFAKDASAYEAAISQINSCNSFEEAKAFLSVVGSEYKWNSESEPVFIFNSIVKRRFA